MKKEKNGQVPRMLTIAETAKITGLPEYFIRKKIWDGEIIYVKAGKKYLVNLDKFIDYLNNPRKMG